LKKEVLEEKKAKREEKKKERLLLDKVLGESAKIGSPKASPKKPAPQVRAGGLFYFIILFIFIFVSCILSVILCIDSSPSHFVRKLQLERRKANLSMI
jgi:hypothetical protein